MVEIFQAHSKMILIAGGIAFVALIAWLMIFSSKAHHETLSKVAEKYGMKLTDDEMVLKAVSDVVGKTKYFSTYGYPAGEVVASDEEFIFDLTKSTTRKPEHRTAYWAKTTAPDVVFRERYLEKDGVHVPGLEKVWIVAVDERAAFQSAEKIKDLLAENYHLYDIEISEGNLIVSMSGKAYNTDMYDGFLRFARTIRDRLK
ncbi:MAG: hypothetical protein ABIL58_25225 [Pseudomonadota bacterium]